MTIDVTTQLVEAANHTGAFFLAGCGILAIAIVSAAGIATASRQALQRLSTARDAWNDYREYLESRYPANDGEPWEFTCPHHKRIDEVLSE